MIRLATPSGPLRMMVLVVIVAGVAACTSRSKSTAELCRSNQEYQRSTSVSGLVIPPDLSPAERTRTLVIPPPSAAAEAAAEGRCLEFPPDFFARDPAGAAAPPP